jgi:hypothetical protein
MKAVERKLVSQGTWVGLFSGFCVGALSLNTYAWCSRGWASPQLHGAFSLGLAVVLAFRLTPAIRRLSSQVGGDRASRRQVIAAGLRGFGLAIAISAILTTGAVWVLSRRH